MVSGVSCRTGCAVCLSNNWPARANSSFRWSFSSVIVPTVERLERTGVVWSMALALGIERVKHQAGFARAAGPRDHREFAGADVQIQVLEVVLACAADTDQSLGHGGSLFRG